MADEDSEVTAGAIVSEALRESVARVVAHEPGVRRGVDPEDVHQMRVGTRRLRSDLTTFESLFDREWVRTLRREIRPLGDALGAVRDRDVLAQRLGDQLGALGLGDDPGAIELLVGLERERDGARATLMALLDDPAHRRRLARLDEAATTPRLAGRASQSAPDVLAPMVREVWRGLRSAVRDAGRNPASSELHEIRKAAKRTRYAAELAARAIGAPAESFARGMAQVQEVLGEHQDAVVAEEWLVQVSVGTPPGVVEVARQLIEVERTIEADCRDQWRDVWEAAARPKRRRWLRA